MGSEYQPSYPNSILSTSLSVIPPTGNMIVEQTGSVIRLVLNSGACFSSPHAWIFNHSSISEVKHQPCFEPPQTAKGGTLKGTILIIDFDEL